MKNFRITKKVVALALSLILAFSAVSIVPFDTAAVAAHEHQYDNEWITEIKETCSYEGLRYKLCKVEGCTYKLEEVVPANRNAHEFMQKSIQVVATCQTTGVEVTKCVLCGEETTVYVEKLPHTVDEEKWTVEKKATCAEKGRKVNTCLECGTKVRKDIFVEHEKISETPETVRYSTCSKQGAKVFPCKNCTAIIEEPLPLDPDNHDYTENPYDVTGISCIQDGKGKVVCKGCGKEKEVTVSNLKAHEYLEWKVVTSLPDDATCISGDVGSMVRYCDICKVKTYKQLLPNHKLEEGYSTKLSTCVKEGYQRGECSICLQSGTEENPLPIDEDAHLWDIVVLEEATCSKEGEILKICSLNDGHVVFEKTEKLEHNLISPWEEIAPNCKEEGIKYSWCTICGYVNEKIPVDKDAHVFAPDVEWIPDPDKKPTCFEEGKEYAMCQKCLNMITRDIPKHTATLVEYTYIPATCQNEGVIRYACTGCGAGTGILDDVILPKDANVHEKSRNLHPVKQATCSTEGLKAHTCLCGYVFDKKEDGAVVVPTTPHTVTDWVVVQQPSCDREGKIERRCVNEGCNYVEENVMPAAHNFTTWREIEPATCTNPGFRTRYCYTCKITEEETFSGSHKDGKWYFVNGGCLVGGTAYLKCDYCKLDYDVKTVKAGEHVDLKYVKEVYPYSPDEDCHYKLYECTLCTENKEVRVTTPHMWMQTVAGLEPSCQNGGWTAELFCPICFVTSPSKILEPLEHVFKYDDEGTKYCTQCEFNFVEDGILETCTHFCHNNGTVMKILNKFLSFFWKIFSTNHFCECGSAHYHNESIEILSYKIDEETGKLVELTYSCEECNTKGKKVQFK